MVLDNIGEQGQIKRKVYQRRLPENPNKDYYYIIRETNPRESILVEYGFIDNPRDLSKLQNDLLDYAEGVVKAIADYTNTPYTPPGQTPTEGNYYTVQKGDTLWSIANKYNLTVDELKRMNNLTSDVLTIGQRLKVSNTTPPDTGDNTGYYTVQRGDTLWSIASRYNLTVDELKRMNNLTSDVLTIGQQLKVSNVTSPDTGDNTGYYTVQKGDTLWSIASKYNLTVDELKRLNNLTSNTISIGQQLKVSSTTPPNSTGNTYIVQKGDSLWSIANKFNVSVNDLINYNNLSSLTLQIGQELKIPTEGVNNIIYTVERGDTIFMGNNE